MLGEYINHHVEEEEGGAIFESRRQRSHREDRPQRREDRDGDDRSGCP